MKTNKGFTLIELLVVVLIIGILAAIAVPKYQVAVMKSKYSTLKAKTKSLAQSVNLYYLSSGGQNPNQFSDLGVELPDIDYTTSDSTGFDIYLKDGGQCVIWTNQNKMVACFLNNFSNTNNMGYYQFWEPLKEYRCYATQDKTVLTVCEQETGKTKAQSECSDQYKYCLFSY